MQTDLSSASSSSSRKWLLIPLGAALLMFVGLAVTGRFQYRLEPDSQDYIDYSFRTLAVAVSGIRTPGYPLFVAIAKSTFGIAAIPFFHWALYSAAVMLLFFGLVRVGVRASSSAVCCAAMMFSRSLTDLGPAVLSDSLAISLAVAAVATALFCVSPGADWKHWFLLSVLVTADYLVRPALLFMLLLVPMLVAWLDFWILRRRDVWYKRFQRALLCAIATILPFIAYCGLRLLVVGEFGFVSFAGYNIVGIAGQAIDEDVIDKIPTESQQLARLIVERRDPLSSYQPPTDYESMEEMFNLVVWQVAVPTAKELFGDNPKVINLKLKKLSQQVLRLRPGFYRQWLLWNGKHAIRNMLELVLRDVGTLLAIALALGGVVFNLVAGKRCSASNIGSQMNYSQLNFELQIVLWIAISYSTACTLLVMLVEPTLARYLTSAIPFWPAFIALLAAQLCERLLSHKCRAT
jgi:hypothetical protein